MIQSIKANSIRTLLLLLSFSLLLFLTSCGGSMEEDDTETTSGSGLQIALSASTATLSAGQSTVVTAKVTDSAGAPVQNKTINFTCSGGSCPSGGTITAVNGGVTDAGGNAVAIYKAGSATTALSLEDTISATSGKASAALVITRTASTATTYLFTMSAGSTSLSAGQSTVISVAVTDGNGAPVHGQTVTFTKEVAPSNPTLTTLGTGVTDASGKVQAVYTAGNANPTANVQDTISATISGGAAYAVVIITRVGSATSGTATTGYSMTVTADPITAAAGNHSIITAKVVDSASKPVSGMSVTFAFLPNSSIGSTLSATSGYTDASGSFTTIYTAGSGGTGAVQDVIQTTVTGVGCNTNCPTCGYSTTAAVIVTRTTTSGTASGIRVDLTAAPTSVDAGGQSVLTATVLDGTSNPVPGATVNFGFITNTTGALLRDSNETTGGSTVTGTTDANGRAVAIYTAGTTNSGVSLQDTVSVNAIMGTNNSSDAFIITRTASSGGTGGTISTGTLALSPSSNSVSYGTPITITATLRDADGALVPNAVVTFTAQGSLVAYTPVSATALTNVSGVASITLNAASIDASGATYISASAPITAGGTTTTITSNPLGIAVNGAAITLGAIALGTPTISTYGSSSVSVPVLINGVAASVPISVNFTSYCVGISKATLSSPVTSNVSTGTAYSTYKDNLCNSGTDTITASVAGGASASRTITVLSPVANNIEFVSATPKIIGTSTASAPGLSKSSIVKFKVVDASNNGIPGVGVTFNLLYNVTLGGVTLSSSNPATSDADGFVTISVTSGTVPTSVWVVATVTGSSPAIKTQSDLLTITTGLPAQNFFSLSVQKHNIEGWKYDGVETGITIIASDRVGNPVPDGTAINFITEGGQIIPASCVTRTLPDGTPDGTCSVTFKSAEFRPSDGRVTILAYATGEESFADTINDPIYGNNSYDSGETFYELGDLYIDANESGTWNSGELFISPPSGSGTIACRTRPSGTLLPFNYVDVPSKQNTCNNAWGISYVRRSDVIVLSGSYGEISPTTVDMGSSCVGEFTLMLTDENGNPMPAGTTVTTKNNAVIWSGNGIITVTGTATPSIGGTPVIDTNALGGTSLSLKLDGGTGCAGSVAAGDTMNYPNGSLTIVTTTPKGVITEIPITVSGTQNIP